MIKKGIFWSVICMLVMLAISVWGWVMIPEGEMIARHWDTAGNPNGFSDKNMVLFMQPIMAAGITLLLAIIPNILPRQENLERSRGFYLAGWIGAMLLMTVIHGSIIYGGVTGTAASPDYVIVITGIFIAVTGNFMAKSKSNWVAGVRNPWTLSSEHAWSVANRLCGYMFVITGVGVALAAPFFGMAAAIYLLMGGVLAAILLSTIVSYFAWRNDPEAGSSA